jgi:hypothetical protein
MSILLIFPHELQGLHTSLASIMVDEWHCTDSFTLRYIRTDMVIMESSKCLAPGRVLYQSSRPHAISWQLCWCGKSIHHDTHQNILPKLPEAFSTCRLPQPRSNRRAGTPLKRPHLDPLLWFTGQLDAALEIQRTVPLSAAVYR